MGTIEREAFMRIIQETIDGSVFRSRILEEYFTFRNTVVADIETTGLSPRSCQVILGGLIMPDGANRLAVQYFADSPADEAELLDRYAAVLSKYDVIVTYNGNRFDLPFLKKRMKVNRISADGLERCFSFDLYRIVKKYSELPSVLPDLKQKTVEQYMGTGQIRRDTIDGAESVRLYRQYVEDRSSRRGELLDRILLHNRDDIVKLSDLMSILRYLDLHEILYFEGFPVSDDNTKAVVSRITVNKKGLNVEGSVFGAPESYKGFSAGMEADVNDTGGFSLRIRTDDVNGYVIADLKALEADLPELQILPGYESGYLILMDREKQIQYHEVNGLVRILTLKLIRELTFSRQLRIL